MDSKSEPISLDAADSQPTDEPPASASSSASPPRSSFALDAPRGPSGLSHWEQTRAAWTAGHKPYSQNPISQTDDWYKDNPALGQVDSTHFDAIYRSLLDGRRFAKAVPLPFVVGVLVHGWKKEGLWSPTTGLGSAYPNDTQQFSSTNNSTGLRTPPINFE